MRIGKVCRRHKAIAIDRLQAIVPTYGVDIVSADFFYRISVKPPHPLRRVESVAVVVQAGFAVYILRAEPVRKDIGQRAGLGDGLAEGVVEIFGNDGALFVHIGRDVAVVVVERKVPRAVDADGRQPAHAARALQGSGEVEVPDVMCNIGCLRARVDQDLGDGVPPVPDEVRGSGCGGLGGAAAM